MLVLLAVVHGSASADFGEQIEGELGVPEVEYVLGPPRGLETALDPAATEERSAKFDAAIERTQHPRARANLILARADLWTARAIAHRASALVNETAADKLDATRAIGRALRDYEQLASAAHLATWRNLAGVLERYAFALALVYRPEALDVYQRLLADFPDSPHAVRAHLIVGGRALGLKLVEDAITHYTAAARPEVAADIRAYATYKLGWIELEELGNGEEAFALLVKSYGLVPSGPLGWELRRSIAKAFSLFGDMPKAYETFARIAPAYALEMAADLADRLRSNRREAEASLVLEELVRRAPDDLRVCEWQASATSSAFAIKDDMQYFRAVERLAQIFERLRHQAIDTAVIGECETAVVTYALEIARTRANPALQRQLRDLFVRVFPDRARLAR